MASSCLEPSVVTDGLSPPPGWKTPTFTKREIKTAGRHPGPSFYANSSVLTFSTHGHLPEKSSFNGPGVITLHGSHGISKVIEVLPPDLGAPCRWISAGLSASQSNSGFAIVRVNGMYLIHKCIYLLWFP